MLPGSKEVLFSSTGQQVVSDYTHKIVIKEDGVQSLIIVPAMPKDAGEWTVIAQNRAGRMSVSVTLTVDGKSDFSYRSIIRVCASKDVVASSACTFHSIHSQRKSDTPPVCGEAEEHRSEAGDPG